MAKQPTERPLIDAIQRNRGIVSSQVLLEAEARQAEIERERETRIILDSKPTRYRHTFMIASVVVTVVVVPLLGAFILGAILGILPWSAVLAPAIAFVVLNVAWYSVIGTKSDEYMRDWQILKAYELKMAKRGTF